MELLSLIIFSIIGVISGVYVFNDCKKRNMSFFWSIPVFFPLYGLIILIIYFFLRKPIFAYQETKTPEKTNLNTNPELNIRIIPETCPHCKSPNTKKIRLCEWCGNQIV